MSAVVLPLSRSLFVCEFHVGYQDGKVDLYGLFNGIRPAICPHHRRQMVVFAQLSGGIGDVPFFLDIRNARTDTVVYTTRVMNLNFPSRTTLMQLAVTLEGCRFPEPGLYTLDLYCHNTWVCDTTLALT
jgi:hypothetical protein